MFQENMEILSHIIPKFRSSHRWCSVKKGVLKNFAKSTGKYLCARVSFLIKLQAPPATLLKKETLAQMLSCEFFEIFKNTSLNEHLWTTASQSSKKLLARYFSQHASTCSKITMVTLEQGVKFVKS